MFRAVVAIEMWLGSVRCTICTSPLARTVTLVLVVSCSVEAGATCPVSLVSVCALDQRVCIVTSCLRSEREPLLLFFRTGLSLDSITGYELVTATGDIVHANAKENPELFVGMRGAGFNFGVVTKFFVKLHPIGHIAKSPSDPNADKVRIW